MSRTYRRTDAEGRHHIRDWLWYDECYWDYVLGCYVDYEDQEHQRQIAIAEYHRDGHWWNTYSASVKEHSRTARRAKERKQLSKVYKCADYDDAYYCPGEEDREQGHIRWVYD